MTSRLRRWLPRQHGAWAMILAPVVTGSLVAGPRPRHVLLAAAWLAAYLAYMAARGWWRAKADKAEWRRPALAYAVVTAALGLALVLPQPRLLAWAPPFLALTGLSAVLVARRRERSVANDFALIAASSLMAVVAAGVGELGAGAAPAVVHLPDWAAEGGLIGVASLTAPITPDYLPPGFAWPANWLASAALAVYFGGTVPYVKTMIRERGQPRWYAASVAYHVAAAGLGFVLHPAVGGLGLLAALRAAAVPKLWPAAKPLHIGLGEIALTTALVVTLVAVLA